MTSISGHCVAIPLLKQQDFTLVHAPHARQARREIGNEMWPRGTLCNTSCNTRTLAIHAQATQLVLSQLVLSQLVLSQLVLSQLVLSQLVLSQLVSALTDTAERVSARVWRVVSRALPLATREQHPHGFSRELTPARVIGTLPLECAAPTDDRPARLAGKKPL